MSTQATAHRSAAGRVAALSRSRTTSDPDLVDARRTLAEANIAEHIRKVVDQAPPLTAEQVDRLSSILRGSGG